MAHSNIMLKLTSIEERRVSLVSYISYTIRVMLFKMGLRTVQLASFTMVFLILASVVLPAVPSLVHKPDEIKSGSIITRLNPELPKSISIQEPKKESHYESPKLETDFEFNAIAPQWKQKSLAHSHESVLQVQVSEDGDEWSPWLDIYALETSDSHKSKSTLAYPEVPVMIKGNFVKYKVDLYASKQDNPEITDIEINYLNTEESDKVSLFDLPSANAAPLGEKIISRKGWGSPDPYGKTFKNSNRYWQPDYQEVSQVFVHHTVNSNRPSNPKDIVKAIWYYHAITRGWGDIGYNYLVDHKGNVYEGRAWGEGVEAGHTLGFNNGSMAIAMLGCYSSDSTCTQLNGGSPSPPTGAMIAGMTDLLSWKMKTHDINIKGTHKFCNGRGEKKCKVLPFIAGHQQAQSTGCPGDLTMARLSNIRNRVAAKLDNANKGYTAKKENYHTSLTLGGPNEVKKFSFKFKNTGTKSWVNTGPNAINLQLASPKHYPSKFKNDFWLNEKKLAKLNESKVKPGEVGTFSVYLKRHEHLSPGNYYEQYKLVVNRKGAIANRYGYEVQIKPISEVFSWEVTERNFFTDDTKSTPADLSAVTVGSPVYVQVIAKNTGKASWLNYDRNKYGVYLRLNNLADSPSELCSDTWINCSKVIGVDNAVEPNMSYGFEFWVDPETAGVINEAFILKVDQALKISGNKLNINVTASD